jgi:hypothetical protein
MQVPGDRYKKSPRPYRGLGDLDYPIHDWTATVTSCGRICYKRRKINLSTVFAGQKVGVKQVSDKIWLVSFMQYDLGYFDHETCRLEPIENPFSPKVLPTQTHWRWGKSSANLALRIYAKTANLQGIFCFSAPSSTGELPKTPQLSGLHAFA